MVSGPAHNLALWAITPGGLDLARRLRQRWPQAALFVSARFADREAAATEFERLGEAVAEQFDRFQGHIFIMATGIVVRSIAAQLRHKASDPAVVVLDDRGRFAISLASGHLGGANRLARETAAHLDATAVITTATDINGKPAIDLLAAAHGMKIENPQCIKAVNMALLTGAPIRLSDEDGWLEAALPNSVAFDSAADGASATSPSAAPAEVWIGDTICDVGSETLVLRPASLAAGIGCNRNTPQREIRDLLFQVLDKFGLAPGSLGTIASIDLKSDEAGLCGLASELNLPLHFFTREELSRVEAVPTPSAVVEKHIGVPSVCEAAAILASRNGRLIVPKHSNKNVTVAIARRASTSSA